MQTDFCVFTKNNLIWQPCFELVFLLSEDFNEFSNGRPIITNLGGFYARLLAKDFKTRNSSKFYLASLEKLYYFLAATACRWRNKSKLTCFIKGDSETLV